MIVRIQGEGQFELHDSEGAELERLDEELFAAIKGGEAETFEAALGAVAQYIRAQGDALPADRLVGSDLILPASDTTLEEARRLLTDEGYLTPIEA
jgi:hypothetical protein